MLRICDISIPTAKMRRQSSFFEKDSEKSQNGELGIVTGSAEQSYSQPLPKSL